MVAGAAFVFEEVDAERVVAVTADVAPEFDRPAFEVVAELATGEAAEVRMVFAAELLLPEGRVVELVLTADEGCDAGAG